MRNLGEEFLGISNSSSKSSSETLNAADTITMALNKPRNIPTDSDLSQAKYIEDKELGSLTSTEGTTVSAPLPFTEAATKKLLRKLDFHLIPFLALLYL
jgi:hypothetical protein